MKKRLPIILWIVLLSIQSFFVQAQKTTTVSYSGSGLDSNLCNVFNTATLAVIKGLTHYPLAGGVKFVGQNAIDLKCTKGTTQATNLGNGYAIGYPFKQGYTYTVTVNASKTSKDPNNFPFLDLSLFVTLPDPSNTSAGTCGPVASNFWGEAQTNPGIYANYVTSSSTTALTEGSFISPGNFDYLSIVVSQGSDTTSTDVKITSVSIKESVNVSISPSQANIICGSTAAQTFTANIPPNATGINSYTWTVGVGWLYNGSAAPSSITTTTNSIQLTPACAGTPGSVAVAANLSNYSTEASTATVNVTPYAISGPTTPVCTAATYSIANLDCPSASINWSISPAGVATLSCTSCAQTTITKVGNSIATLTASITGGCLTGTTTLNQDLQIGAPQVGIASTPVGTCSGAYQTWYLSVQPSGVASNYNWTAGPVSGDNFISISNSIGSSTYADVKGGGPVNLAYVDQCGVSHTDGVTIYSSCHSTFAAFTLSPNPATTTVMIRSTPDASSFAPAADAKKGTHDLRVTNPATIEQINIFDVSGKLRKTFRYSTKLSQTEINVADLIPGIYFLEIRNGSQTTHEKIIIRR